MNTYEGATKFLKRGDEDRDSLARRNFIRNLRQPSWLLAPYGLAELGVREYRASTIPAAFYEDIQRVLQEIQNEPCTKKDDEPDKKRNTTFDGSELLG